MSSPTKEGSRESKESGLRENTTRLISSQSSSSSHSSKWEKYQKLMHEYTNDRVKKNALDDPGYFAKKRDEAQFYYEICCLYSIERNIIQNLAPILSLPLIIYVLRSNYNDDSSSVLNLGCSNALNKESMNHIVQGLNNYWMQASIKFEPVNIIDLETKGILPVEFESDANEIISKGRGLRGQDRKSFFINKLLRTLKLSLNTSQIIFNHHYEVWFMDTIGDTLQGVCIDRRNRTIIMGERSTKGYKNLTARPHECLAKTMAHELGHALGLNHPKGMKFKDGKNRSNKNNLMTGGKDSMGGGGHFLENWQMLLARSHAENFLDIAQR
mmetsp:Transcript_6433/g.9349  ORF Transcript_6433/g.9349 Transcript_6433/m.9349 type:complete len:327 (+) Transcript_6433:125-1105(+)